MFEKALFLREKKIKIPHYWPKLDSISHCPGHQNSSKLCLKQHFCKPHSTKTYQLQEQQNQTPSKDTSLIRENCHYLLPLFVTSLYLMKLTFKLFSVCIPNLAKFLRDQCESRLNCINFHRCYSKYSSLPISLNNAHFNA